MKICFVIILGLFVTLSVFKTLGIYSEITSSVEYYAGGDKSLHFWGAGFIAFFSCYFFRRQFSSSSVAFWLMVLLLTEEFSQIFLPNRHFNLDDVGAGCIGVLVCVFLFKVILETKLILSTIFYGFGHLVSVFLYCDYFAFLYPVYKKLMILSSDLDKDGKVWDNINK
jgi:VanZ family protein